MRMLQKMKDCTLSKGGKALVNKFIARYGRLESLDLDTAKKKIELSLRLKGEKESLMVLVDRYTLVDRMGKSFVGLEGVRTSRTWLNTILNKYISGRMFEIPNEYAKALKTIA